MTDSSTGWQNWSGGQRYAATVQYPRTAEEVQALVNRAAGAGRQVRAVGTGHSFVPFWTDGEIVSLDHFAGVHAVDPSRAKATIGAGTKLHDLGPLLWAQGLSLPQQGDIDRQSIAGAIGTGTHGTGKSLQSLSNLVRSMRLVTAEGSIRELHHARDPELFAAACVAQGTCGIMLDVTLALAPAYNLHERTWSCSFEECGERWVELVNTNRHFEFFWTPATDRCDMKVLNRTDAAPRRLGESEYIAPAWEAFPSDRDIRFNEMEYSVPCADGWACFVALRERFLRDFSRLPWPIEFRTLAADDLPISTAQGRDTITLSVHQGAERDWRPVFEAAEAIFRTFEGRPHWGKLHSLHAADVAALYPRFDDFRAARERLDPSGVFLNDYLRRLLVG